MGMEAKLHFKFNKEKMKVIILTILDFISIVQSLYCFSSLEIVMGNGYIEIK